MTGELLGLGSVGARVGTLQQMLVEAGFAIDEGECTLLAFGASTRQAVCAYQVAHGLPPDGIVGPKTWHAFEGVNAGGFVARGWRLDWSQVRAQVLPAVQAAVGEIGTVEAPPHSNRGRRIDSYWRRPPSDTPGPAWCTCFVSWSYGHVDGGSPFGFKSSTFDLADWGRAHGRTVPDSDPVEPGDIGLILRDPVNRHGHTTMIVLALGDGMVGTCEGNSGDAVRGLIRERRAFGCIVRPVMA